MKTTEQIEAKIKEHEFMIEASLSEKPEQWNEFLLESIESLLKSRKALLWVLSDEELLPESDKFENEVRYELMTFIASKIL